MVTALKNSDASGQDRTWILFTLCLCVLLVQVDTSVVNLAVHAISVALHAPLTALQWVVDGYNLTYAVLLMSGGVLADLFGRRRILMLGTAIFTLGTVLCGLATSSEVLISGRVIAGIGAALLLPSTLALIRVIWTEPKERAHAIGIWAGTNGAALAIGPTLGGLLIKFATWRSVFLLIAPIGLAVLWLVPRVIPESSDPQGRQMDLPGQIFAGLTLAGLAMAVIEHGRIASISAVVGALSLLLFLLVEKRAGPAAMMPLRLFRNRMFSGAIVIAASMTFGMYGVLFLLPMVWQLSGTLSVTWAGVALLPMSLAFIALSHKSGAWSNRFGSRCMMAGGMALIGCGIGALALTHSGRPLGLAILGLLLTGIGMALNTGPLLAVAVASVESSRSGIAAALLNTARMVGATLGVAVLGALYALSGFAAAMRIGAAVALAGAVIAALTISG
ncbi:MAG: MFS transporter [Sulfuriferula sp.]